MLQYDNKQIIDWMEGVRKHPDMVNAFWPSQINSKNWLCDWVKSYLPSANRIIIFGSWYGVLADMLQIKIPKCQIMCVDKDKEPLMWSARKHAYWHGDMITFDYDTHVDLVINTVTEHLTQEIYNKWYSNIPKGTYFVIQGNNDYNEPDHVRATNSLEMFNKINNVKNVLHSESLTYEGPWNMEASMFHGPS